MKNFINLLFLFIFLKIICAQLITQYFDKRIPDEETVLTEEDYNRIRRVKRATTIEDILRDFNSTNATINDSAMYRKDRFEGDIVNPGLNSRVLKSYGEEIDLTKFSGLMRNAVRQPYLRWPNGRIPFTISKQYSLFGRDRIAEAIEEYQKRTCIKFTPKTASDNDYIHILPDDGCYSLVGKVGGKQPVSLGDGCISKGIIIHELMHAIGFFHEQSRADRDDFVNVKWENVENGLQDQFDKYSLNMIDELGANYDYGSIMHYGPTAFSKNGQPTIEPKTKGVNIGQRLDFSEIDLFKINKLYKCQNNNPSKMDAQPETTISLTISSNGGGGKGCSDQRSDCVYLASQGYCEASVSISFMAVNCGKTCGKCSSDEAVKKVCEDTQQWCKRWAINGLCDMVLFQQYMHQACPQSCAIC